MNLSVLKFFIFFAILNLTYIECLPKFIRGRRFERKNLLKGRQNITDLYFEQRLDHFNEALKTTWQQVDSLY